MGMNAIKITADSDEAIDREIQTLVHAMILEIESIEAGGKPSPDLWKMRSKLLQVSHRLRPSDREWLVILLLAYEIIFVNPLNLKSITPIKKLLFDLMLGGEKSSSSFVM